MSRTSKEEFEDSEGSSKISKVSHNDLNEIDKVLSQLQTTYVSSPWIRTQTWKP